MSRKLGGKLNTRRKFLKRGVAASSVSVLGLATLSGTAVAAKISVPDDYSTIQAAVDAADEGDVIVVDGSAPGEYREQVIVRKDLTVRGVNNPTLLPPSGSLGVGDIAVIQPIFGAVGYENEVDFEGFTVDGEFKTDKGGFYSCVGYYKADGTVRDLTATGADYGGYISQNRGGGGDQNVDVYDSHFKDLGLGSDVNQHLVHNEPGTTGEIKRCTFVGDEGVTGYLYGLSPGYGASITAQQNTFEDFYGGSFQLGFYGFNTPDCTLQRNEFQACQYPIYFTASSRVQRTGADEQRIVQNSIDGTGVPANLDSYGTTLYAYDTSDSDGRTETVNNVKIINNDYANLDNGVASFETGEGVVQNTKIIRNEFEAVDDPITDNGEATKKEANRI